MEISELNRIRKEKRITYSELSEMSLVPRRTIENLFGGKTIYPRIETIQALEKALGIEEERQKEKPPELSDGQLALLELFNQVPAEQQELVLEMIRAALKSLG